MSIWEDVVNPVTGEHSLTENIQPRLIKTYCKDEDHVFHYVSPSCRDAECVKCGLGRRLVLGIHKLVDGKIIPLS